MAKTNSELNNLLNEDLAYELSAVIQYLTYAAKATGPYRPQLAQFFLAEIADEQLHAQFLANKIVALGGEPVAAQSPLALSSQVETGWTSNASDTPAGGEARAPMSAWISSLRGSASSTRSYQRRAVGASPWRLAMSPR